MFRKTLKLLFTSLCIAAFTACSSSSSDSLINDSLSNGSLSNDAASDSSSASGARSWTIDEFSYTGSDITSLQIVDQGRVTTNSSTTGFDTSNGAFSGSVINIFAVANGSGTYPLVSSQEDFAAVQLNSPGTAVAYVTVQAGTLATSPLASTLWESSTGVLEVTLDDDGVSHYSTVEPITFIRSLDLGSGVPGAPDQVSVTINDLSGTLTSF